MLWEDFLPSLCRKRERVRVREGGREWFIYILFLISLHADSKMDAWMRSQFFAYSLHLPHISLHCATPPHVYFISDEFESFFSPLQIHFALYAVDERPLKFQDVYQERESGEFWLHQYSFTFLASFWIERRFRILGRRGGGIHQVSTNSNWFLSPI